MLDRVTLTVDLDAVAKNDKPKYGELKLTMEKFYRVNGGSTQLKGVVPDIQLPDANAELDDDDMGERRNKAALPYDEIAPANYHATNSVGNLRDLGKMSQSRVNSNATFKLIQQTAVERKHKMEDKSVSLNEKQFRKEQEEANATAKKVEELQKKASNLEIVNIAAEKSEIEVDSTATARNKEWLKNLGKDIYISETVNIVNDLAKSGMKVNMGTGKR